MKTKLPLTIGLSSILAASLFAGIPAATAHNDPGYVHGILIHTNEGDYYLEGPPDGPNGATDIPGHYWVMAGPDQLVGKHYNTGPFGTSNWWSSDAQDDKLLYIVHAKIGPWSPEIAEEMKEQGYAHYHELVNVNDGSHHPYLVVWLKHIAVTPFTLDGGPHPEFSHKVTPGIDYEFIPNGMMPYSP